MIVLCSAQYGVIISLMSPSLSILNTVGVEMAWMKCLTVCSVRHTKTAGTQYCAAHVWEICVSIGEFHKTDRKSLLYRAGTSFVFYLSNLFMYTSLVVLY